MQTNKNESPNGLYFLQPHVTRQQLLSGMKRCLCKAEALAALVATADLEALAPEMQSNYLWALSDVIQEARWLYEKAIN